MKGTIKKRQQEKSIKMETENNVNVFIQAELSSHNLNTTQIQFT